MATSRTGRIPFWSLVSVVTALGPSCEQPRQRFDELWKGAHSAVWGAKTPIADAAPPDAAPTDTNGDADADASSNAFDRQKPVPRNLIVEFSLAPHRFLRLHTTEADVSRFLDGLKKALRDKNYQAIADAMNYPLVVAIGPSDLVVEDRDQFLAEYDRVMTPAVVGAIRTAAASNVRIPARSITLGRGQNRLHDYLGMSIGPGRIWFDLAEVNPPPVSRYRLLVRLVNAGARP
jgi:hypothetical protein